MARIRQIFNRAIPTTPDRVLGIAVNPIPRFRSFLTQQLNRQTWQAKLPSSARGTGLTTRNVAASHNSESQDSPHFAEKAAVNG